MNNKKEKFARFGIATKGFVHCLIGGLTAMAAFGIGGQTSDSNSVLEFLAGQPFGMILLIATTIGLAGYVFYRFYQSFVDPEGKGRSAKGIASRTGYFFSGLFYVFLAFTAIEIVLGSGSGSGGGGGNKTLVAELLSQTFGQILVGILGLIFLGKAVYQFYRAYSGAYKKKLQTSGVAMTTRNLLLKSGKIGYTARGIVIGVISFLIFRAALRTDSNEAGGTEEAFRFMQNEFGVIALAVIALGLVSYGIFMFVKAKYERIYI